MYAIRSYYERRHSTRVQDPGVQARVAAIRPQDAQRTRPYAERSELQRQRWQLPAWPTTSIGSFPQTADIRALRREWREGRLSLASYNFV